MYGRVSCLCVDCIFVALRCCASVSGVCLCCCVVCNVAWWVELCASVLRCVIPVCVRFVCPRLVCGWCSVIVSSWPVANCVVVVVIVCVWFECIVGECYVTRVLSLLCPVCVL